MPPHSGAVQQVATLASVTVLRDLLESGVLDKRGLIWLRGRLDRPGEFAECTQLELLQLDVNERLAWTLNCDPSDLPGADTVPDDPRGLD